MVAALRAWRRGFSHLNHRGYLYIWANLWWALLTVPIITAPAAWAGLTRLSYVAFRSPAVTLDDFWQGVRENLGRGAALAVLNIVVVVVNLTNILAYRDTPGLGASLLRGIWILVLVLWFGAQFYLWPLYYSLERPSLAAAFRNAAVMMLRNPVFTLVSWVGIVLVLIVSIALVPAVVLLTGSALAVVANSLVMDRLRAAGYTGDLPPENADADVADGGLYGDI